MRVSLVCTVLCAVFPASVQASWDAPPTGLTFAYASRHDVAPITAKQVDAMRPGEDVSVYRREDAEPVLLPPDQPLPGRLTRAALCNTVASVALANDLPVPFFANLIQQESAFRPYVISPVGAQGIAQFMPRTARAYGLVNPFDPIHAIVVSGQFLRELIGQLGNVGLAAAAYNAGIGRVLNWVQDRGALPEETQAYVKTITGRPALQWARPKKDDEAKLPPHARCPELALADAGAVAMKEPLVRVALAAPQEVKLAGKGTTVTIAAAAKGRRVSASIRIAKDESKPGARTALAKSEPTPKAGGKPQGRAATAAAGRSAAKNAGPAVAAKSAAAKPKTSVVSSKPAARPGGKPAGRLRVADAN